LGENMIQLLLLLCCTSFLCAQSENDLSQAIAQADVLRIEELVQQGVDVNACYGEKKRTALMLSVDHLAGDILEAEQKIVDNISYLEWIAGTLIIGGIGVFGWWWSNRLEPAAPVVAPAPAHVDEPEDVPPLEPEPESPPAPKQQPVIPLVLEPQDAAHGSVPVARPTRVPVAHFQDQEADSSQEPTAYLIQPPPPQQPQFSKPLTRFPAAVQPLHGRGRDVQRSTESIDNKHVPVVVIASKKEGPWKRFKRFIGVDKPDCLSRESEEESAVVPTVSSGVAVLGASLLTNSKRAVAESHKRVAKRAAVVNVLLKCEGINCQATDADGKTVVDLIDGYRVCKLAQLQKVLSQIRAVIVARQV
jgi:hypothetical protein